VPNLELKERREELTSSVLEQNFAFGVLLFVGIFAVVVPKLGRKVAWFESPRSWAPFTLTPG
jgi:hypothetical protein